jgi:hypothetical protein
LRFAAATIAANADFALGRHQESFLRTGHGRHGDLHQLAAVAHEGDINATRR